METELNNGKDRTQTADESLFHLRLIEDWSGVKRYAKGIVGRTLISSSPVPHGYLVQVPSDPGYQANLLSDWPGERGSSF